MGLINYCVMSAFEHYSRQPPLNMDKMLNFVFIMCECIKPQTTDHYHIVAKFFNSGCSDFNKKSSRMYLSWLVLQNDVQILLTIRWDTTKIQFWNFNRVILVLWLEKKYILIDFFNIYDNKIIHERTIYRIAQQWVISEESNILFARFQILHPSDLI